MILEYAESGNLFGYQNKKQIFSEPEAYVYFSQVLSAIKYLHSIDIMHRDLKVNSIIFSPKTSFLTKTIILKFVILDGLQQRLKIKEKPFVAPMSIWLLKCWKGSNMIIELIFGLLAFFSMNFFTVMLHLKVITLRKLKLL